MATLPEQLRLSLTWDQDTQMADHVAIAQATGPDIYVAAPAPEVLDRPPSEDSKNHGVA